jgi:hypothetical protein
LTSEFKFFSDGGQPPAPTPETQRPATGAKATADDWRRTLKGKEPKAAFEMVVAEDSVAAYEAYVGLFAQASYTPRVRSLLERRREMLAWANAVTLNTGAAYELFLANYGGSDLAATARKLEERVRNRNLAALASLAPNCPVPANQPLKKHTENPPPTKKSSTKNKSTKEAAEGTPTTGQSVPPGAVLEGIGIGVGIGLGVGGMGRGGMHDGGGRGVPATGQRY